MSDKSKNLKTVYIKCKLYPLQMFKPQVIIRIHYRFFRIKKFEIVYSSHSSIPTSEKNVKI